MQPVIIDIIVVCVLLGFTLWGAHRGLFRSLIGLTAVIIALVGAGLFAKVLTQPVTDLLTPMLESKMEQRVEDAIAVQNVEMPSMPTEPDTGHRLEELLGLLGMDPETVESISQQAMGKLQEAGTSLAAAVVESLMYSLLYGILFLLAFLALLLALHLLARAFDLVLKLPVLHGLNTLGGAAFGILEGGLLMFLAVWAARHLGVSFETELVAATHVLRFFTTNTPLSVVSFLL